MQGGGRELTSHATGCTNSLCSKREAGDTTEARASAGSSGTSSASTSGHVFSSAVGSSSFSRDRGGGSGGGGSGSGADTGSSSNDVGDLTSAVLGDSQLHEVGLGLGRGGVDRESHALATVGALSAVEP